MCGGGNFISNIGKSIVNEVEETGKAYSKDPERPLLGINTPFETNLWGSITGKDYTPTTDMMGSVDTEHNRNAAAQKGIKTGPHEALHGIAKAVTAFFGGQALGGLAAGAEGAAGAGGAETLGAEGGEIAGASGGSTAAGGGEAASDSVVQAQAAGATSSGSSATPAESFGSDVGEMMPAAVPDASTTGSTASSATSASKATSVMDSLKTASTILTPAMSLLAAASGVSAAKKSTSATAPKAPPPTALPDTTNGKGVLSAPAVKRQVIQDQLARRGRASTILTSPGDKLGA